MRSGQTSPLLRQASLRLALSLLAALLLIGSIGWGVYAASERKATENETRAVFVFYENKLKEWEAQWESEALRAKSRLEFNNILENPQKRWSRLRSFLTVQGEQHAFQNVLISDADDHVLFRFGPEEENPPAVMPHKTASWWYFDPRHNKLFRVYHQDIWLGAQGMGHLILLKQLDNALLFQNTYAQTDLFLLWQGKAVASSLGGGAALADIGDGSYRLNDAVYHQRRLEWAGAEKDVPNLLVRHKTAGLFKTWQLALGGLAATLALFGTLSGTLGLWLFRNSQRISALGKASQAFDADYRHTEEIRKQLAIAASGRNDEIDQVADSLEHLTEAVLQRDRERSAKEEALAESEARTREITESLVDGVFVVDSGLRISFVNPQAAMLLGYRQEELLGRDSHATLHHTKQDGAALPFEQCVVHQAILHGEPFRTSEDFFIRKDGSYLTASLAATPILRHGEIVGSVVAFQDIGERLAAERTIRESEERFRLLFNSGSDAIFVYEIGEEPGRFVEVNDIACQRLGYTREELLGMTPADIEDPELSPSDTEKVGKELEEHWHALFECVHVAKDGRRIPVEIGAHLLTLNGKTSVLSVVRDISERKAVEAAREAALRNAERLARARSEFLANMSHEIRTPLNGVLGLTQIGMRDCGEPKSRETFSRIRDSGSHLLAIVNDILDFSKIEAGKMCVESRPFRLTAIIDDTVDMLAESARSKGLTLSVARAATVPEWVEGDPMRLKQILLNLLSNAIKFTERGQVTLKLDSEGENVLFQVADTGIGMIKSQLARVFHAFEQADGSTTRKYGGTGLGLAISHNLARLMGGDIQVVSQIGVGSTFSLSLPLPSAAPGYAAEPEAPAGKRRLAGLRVLAADDVDLNRLILEDLLTHEGAHVVFANDGQQALERLEAAGVSAFDVVLMDVQMPVMDGLEATRHIAAIAPGLPVIGFTAHAMAEERDQCLAAGMVDHVVKPVDIDTLVAAIRRQVSLEIQSAPTVPTTTAAAELSGDTPFAGCDDPDIIDLAILASRVGNAPAKIAKYVTLFIETARNTQAEMKAALAAKDLPTLGALGHRLKSAAFTVGAMRFGELCLELEHLKDSDDLEAAHARVDQLQALFERIAQRVKDAV